MLELLCFVFFYFFSVWFIFSMLHIQLILFSYFVICVYATSNVKPNTTRNKSAARPPVVVNVKYTFFQKFSKQINTFNRQKNTFLSTEINIISIAKISVLTILNFHIFYGFHLNYQHDFKFIKNSILEREKKMREDLAKITGKRADKGTAAENESEPAVSEVLIRSLISFLKKFFI